MDEKLYYEAAVKYSDDVQAVYETAVAKNVKFYRGISPSGKYFGWVDGKLVHADDGQEWFANKSYIAPDPIDEQPIETVVDVSRDARELAELPEEEVDASAQEAFDYEARIAELEKALAEKDALLNERTDALAEREGKLVELENAVKVIVHFIKGV